ncbi:LacI family transcriptional regulator [Rathayibacter sp. ZW T2_19]|uniref:LacI family transcriptional regulator n=1 Tax=Rathayibacter rubneri TaxID=2950106 RepID=A0A9X2DUQ0_9MICO|nr:LacI family transcriptional regulator [Rathayibacter rubneri]
MAQSRSSGSRTSTLSDVAKLAGVSMATASKAINGRSVAPATRVKVMEAARELSFTPNALARSLVEGRTGTVGILTNDLEGRFVIPILMGAEDAFGAGAVNVFLCDARGDAIREQHHLAALLNRRVDGILVVGSSTNPRPSLGHDLPVPVVYVYAPSEDPTDVSLAADNYQGGRLATEHLLGLGRRRIAHLTGDPSYQAAQDRARGVRDAMRDADLELVSDVMFSEWSESWGRDGTAVLLERHADLDGIVCGSDQIARGALDSARDLGRKVPEDVAVVGFDNWLVLATNARPQLTSIDADLQELGRAAAHRVFEAIGGSPASGTQYLPTRLVIRGSTIARR